MICNSKEPIGIAGIMGGELSSISDDTSSVLWSLLILTGPLFVNQQPGLGLEPMQFQV